MASELAAALAKFQAELPHIAKAATADVKNKEGRKLYEYKYADLEDVSAAILPLLGKHGLAFTAWPTLDDGRFVLSYSLLHESGEARGGIYPLPSSGTPQDLGKHITYARRYCLCAVTGVAPGGEDNDAAGATEVHMDRPRGGPERYTGWDRPSETPVKGPRPGPEHEQLRNEPPSDGGLWDGEEHWKDQSPGELPKPPAPNGQPKRRPKMTPAQAIHVHLGRLGVTDGTDQLVQATILAGRSELLEHVSDLDMAKQQEISGQLAKLKDRAALDALLAAKRAEVPS